MLKNVGNYSKGIVAVIGIATTVIATYYATANWAPAAIQGLAALGVILVPNQQASPPTNPVVRQP